MDTTEKRFWAKVQKTNGCWLWIGAKRRKGYGHFYIAGKHVSVHRYSYELHFGQIPDGLLVLHNCPGGDNPSCVNPAHLWLGTDADNMADMERKGRGNHAIGEDNGSAKLTESAVREIFQDSKNGMLQQKIADKHKVTRWQIANVLNKKSWAHLWK